MRKRKSVRIIAVALLCTLMIGAAIGIGVAADDATGENVATLGMRNLAYNAELNLAVEVKQVMEGDLGLGVWAADVAQLTEENAIKITYELNTTDFEGQTVCYAFSHGIAAKDIDTEYIFAAVVKDAEGVLHIGQTATYSVSDYLSARLKEDITPEQETLYNAVIAYGAAAKDDLFGQK